MQFPSSLLTQFWSPSLYPKALYAQSNFENKCIARELEVYGREGTKCGVTILGLHSGSITNQLRNFG